MFLKFLMLSFITFLDSQSCEYKLIESILDEKHVPCLRCICYSTSTCYELKKCAKLSVSYNYWLEAGALTLNSTKSLIEQYNECISNDTCILATIQEYSFLVLMKLGDINCDGSFDCRDIYAAHKFGMTAKSSTSTFSTANTKRFDRCGVYSGISNLTSNWIPSKDMCQLLDIRK